MNLGDPLGQIVLRDVRDPVGEGLVVTGPLKQAGIALDRSVDDKLDAAEAEAIGIGLVPFGKRIETALSRDLRAFEDLDDRIENDAHRKVGVGGNRLIGLVTAWKAAEGEIGEGRHADAMCELGSAPGRLEQGLGIERRQFRGESKCRLDLLDFTGRLAVLLDDPDDIGVVGDAGDLERLAVGVIDMHRQVLDEDRMAVGDRIEVGAGKR